MITQQHGNCTFTFRVAAVIIEQNRVLLQKSENGLYWFLPGGRVEFLEPAAEALAREMREELGAVAVIERLLWVHENFFFHRERENHELGLYYLTRLTETSLLSHECFEGIEDENQNLPQRLWFRWFSLEASTLKAITIYPTFLQHSLLSIPDQVTHLTTHPNA